jgi:tetrahydromethanopterin S-methyltransferase subunit A
MCPESRATVTSKANEALRRAAEEIEQAALAKKCRPCGCLHDSLSAIEREIAASPESHDLIRAISIARKQLTEVEYDCLGCEHCFPAVALNALEIDSTGCPADKAEPREGWPPLPGNFRVLAFMAPVAVCTLTDESLMLRLSESKSSRLSIVGTLQTENLGIERVIENVVSNPHIRFLILCGTDSQKRIGHLPGQSILALSRNGMGERGRISGAQGRRPVLKNIPEERIDHFRRHIEVRDMIGNVDAVSIFAEAESLSARNPGLAPLPTNLPVLSYRSGRLPAHMTSDPAGFFVIHIDRRAGRILLEHYENDGLIDDVISGRTAPEIYCTAIESRHISRLDHAAYLGRELARAEDALRRNEPFVQDAAPEAARIPENVCGCSTSRAAGNR